MENKISMDKFNLQPNTRKDCVYLVSEALKECKKINGATLVFEKGTYHFWPDLAYESLYFISNNDDGLKKVAFPLIGFNNFTIDGQGSNFIFHGVIIPFVIQNSKNIHIKNINIDWERPFISQGEVINTEDGIVDLKIPDQYPYYITNNKIRFRGEGWEEPLYGFIEMDKDTMAPAYQSGDNIFGWDNKGFIVQDLGRNIIRFKGNFSKKTKIGNHILLRHARRLNPAIFIQRTSQILLKSINIYHAGAMGVIGQKSEDITLDQCNVMIKPNSNRAFSLPADATHFVNCKGLITLQNCLFENQMDDATNVHGIYKKIIKKLDNNKILVELIHHQHKGVRVFDIGDKVGFIDHDSLLTYFNTEVKEIERLNKDYSIITLMDNIPDEFKENDGLENKTWNADLLVKNCEVRANRARGLLISTPGKVIVEGNHISVPGAGIKISGDVNSWFESGSVKDVTIKNNIFKDCNYVFGPWGKACIDIDPEIKEPSKYEPLHDKISIINNTFKTFNTCVVSGFSVNELLFNNNIIEKTTTYKQNSDCDDIVSVDAKHKKLDIDN